MNIILNIWGLYISHKVAVMSNQVETVYMNCFRIKLSCIWNKQYYTKHYCQMLLHCTLDLITFCNNYGGKELKKWILALIGRNYCDIWDEWKTSKKASELPEDDKEFIEENLSPNRDYLNFSEKFRSLYW